MSGLPPEQIKEKVLQFLATVPGKGVEVTARIAKAIGVDRREASAALRVLEEEGKVVTAGANAGVIGFKLKKD